MTAANVSTYSPEEISFTIAGYKIEDWDEITVTPTQPAFKEIRGIRGKNTRVKVSSNYSATITFTILQTSSANTVLSNIHQKDLQNGTGRLEVFISDLSGQTQLSSFECYIESMPTTKFTGTADVFEWTLICQSLENWNSGGNVSLAETVLKQISNKISSLF